MRAIDWDAVWDGIGYPRPHNPEVSDWTVQVQKAVEAQLAAREDKLAKVVRLLKDAIEEASPFTGCASKRQRNFAIVLHASFAEHILREIGEE